MRHTAQILVVDDDRAMREMLASLFKERGLWVEEAASANAALELAAEREFDVVLSDIRMPGLSGIELIGQLRKLRPNTPVVLMTAFGTIDSAVDAMRAGAFDYITKPFEPDAVTFAIDRAIERSALARENESLRRAVQTTGELGELIGTSAAMRDIIALIERVGHSKASVLITGESGTGKEVIARTLHFHGARSDKPFVPINCTAIPEGLLESELFGHVRGAFTGAHTNKRGLFEKANAGTLFLDEVGDMGLALQGKLLRVLQDREIRPVGGTQTVRVDVRIIAATNKDLSAEISAGRFREDLFYRLNVVPIHVPPLRERPDDVPALVEAFLRRHGEGRKRFISAEALAVLRAQAWRGNARELENTIERALALSDAETLGPADIPLPAAGALAPAGATPGAVPDLDAHLRAAAARGMSLRELDEKYTALVLAHTGGNKVRASQILGIDRKTLYRRAERRAHESAATDEE
ncbi:MAG TPA: sigma-54 dependent transcriptional regulator [Myxococcota bacterium]|jgi:DNA-binding NtrC family response regulator